MLLLLCDEWFSGKRNRSTPRKLSCLPSPCSIPQLEMEHARPQPATSLEGGTPRLEGTVRDSLPRSSKGTSPPLQVCSFRAALSPDTGSPQLQGWQKSQGAAHPHCWALQGPPPALHPVPGPRLMGAVALGWRHLLPIPVQPSQALERFDFSSLTSKTENR